MRNWFHTSFMSKRDGIALVVVLGLLAVLLIVAVAFSTAMRTERLATRYYLEGVKARHLVHTALFRVLGDHITGEMAGLTYPDWTARYEMFPPEPGNPEVYLLGDGTINSPMRWIPLSLRPPNWSNANIDHGGVNWQELRDPITDEFYGEYAYLVVNNTGLLDANVIGAREGEDRPRLRGFNPREIRFHDQVLPEVANNTLHLYRDEFRRFESVPELYYLTSGGVFESGDQIGAPRPLRQLTQSPASMADNLHVFSRYPRGYGELGPDDEWDERPNLFYIGGDPAEWDLGGLDEAIEDVLDNADHRTMFIRALYDYADEGLVPFGASEVSQFQRFSAKPVPMINEVIMSNTVELIEGPPHILRHNLFIEIETWYPFPEPLDPVPYSIEIVGLDMTVIPPYPSMQAPPTEVSGPTPATFVPEAGSFNLTRFVYQQDQEVTDNDGVQIFPYGLGVPFQVAFGASQIRVVNAGDPVDIVFGPWPQNRLRINGMQPDLVMTAPGDPPQPRGIGPNGEIRPVGASANDPRINWDPADDLHWRNVAPTPGERNAGRIDGEVGEYGYSTDEINWMYARRGPIQSVGEIGYLLFDPERPWTTVPLLDHNADVTALLDRLTVHTNRIRRGLVNVNSRQTNALMTAVWQAPVERYPTQPIVDDRWVTDSMAEQLANALIIETTGPNGPIANLSEIGRAWTPNEMNSVLNAYNAVNDKFIRESVLRNSLGVLGTRHNLFTIFVAARVFVEGYNPSTDFGNREDFVASDQRAVAVVWRDPFRTSDSANIPTYESFVQYFHWVTDALED